MTAELKVLVFGTLQKAQAEKLASLAQFKEIDRQQGLSQSEMIESLEGVHAVISEPLDILNDSIIDRCPDLALVANRAVGFDNVDLSKATSSNILVTNTPGVLDDATADLAFALLLAACRRVCEADRYIRQGNWTGFKSDLMLGPDIKGKTLGIVGLGRIGKAFARRARAFGLNIIYCSRSSVNEAHNLRTPDLEAKRVSFDELLNHSDFISLHCPLNQSTRHLIKKAQLDLMKPDAVLINTARGAVIDEKALARHLAEKKIFAAGLDVFEDEPNVSEALKGLDNVVLTPHIGSACIETRRTMTDLALNSLLDAFSGKKPEHMVNPEAWPGFLKRTIKPMKTNG
ncbi:MAG: D-glycerate dehydrogenase [Candidatus Obscuribacterales bacterium]|nr:D-glycerate dehydrogenase [Candidatus Obscuribacterales bacterium]